MSARWPSRYPVWTLGALGVAALLFCAQLWVQYAREWSEAERVYLGDYLRSGIRGVWPGARGRYVLLNGVTVQGQARLVLGDEAERVKDADGKPGYRLTDEGIRLGLTHLEWQAAVYNDRGLHGLLRHWIYRDGDLWSYAARPFYGSLALFALGLFVAVPKDRARRAILKHGRRLKGPELVTAAEFNTRLGRSKSLMLYLPDGVAFANERMGWSDRLLNKNSSGWVRIPREREGMHFVLAGDSGPQKIAAIRQILTEARARGEAAVVYDPAMEYLARYYDSRTGTFCSADPLAGSPSDPQSWNRYPYGRNDPIDITDPSGQSWWSSLLIDIGVAIASYFLGPEINSFLGLGGTTAGAESWTAIYNGQILAQGGATYTWGAGAGSAVFGAAAGAEAQAAAQQQPKTPPTPEQRFNDCNSKFGDANSKANLNYSGYQMAQNAANGAGIGTNQELALWDNEQSFLTSPQTPSGTFVPNSAGAVGPMQITPITSADLNQRGLLPANYNSDPYANLLAGARYLRSLMSRGFSSNAAAAYTGGPNAFKSRAAQKYQQRFNHRSARMQKLVNCVH